MVILPEFSLKINKKGSVVPLIPSKKTEISLLNIFLCCLVIFIHLCATYSVELRPDSPQFAGVFYASSLCNFAVYGFVLISGVKHFLRFDAPFSYRKFYTKRLFTIILPYIFWVIIYYAYFQNEIRQPWNTDDLLNHMLYGTMAAQFYFVIIISQFYLLFPLWRYMVRNIHPIIGVIGAVLIYVGHILGVRLLYTWDIVHLEPWRYFDRFFLGYIVFWVVGCYMGRYYEQVKAFLQKRFALVAVAFCLFLGAFLVIKTFHLHQVYSRPYWDIITNGYFLLAILFFFTLGTFIARRDFANSLFIKRENSACYYIFLSHLLLLYIVKTTLIDWGITDVGLGLSLCTVLTYGILFSFWYFYEVLEEKLRFCLLKSSNVEKMK